MLLFKLKHPCIHSMLSVFVTLSVYKGNLSACHSLSLWVILLIRLLTVAFIIVRLLCPARKMQEDQNGVDVCRHNNRHGQTQGDGQSCSYMGGRSTWTFHGTWGETVGKPGETSQGTPGKWENVVWDAPVQAPRPCTTSSTTTTAYASVCTGQLWELLWSGWAGLLQHPNKAWREKYIETFVM